MNKKQITMVTIALMLGNVMSGLDGTIINTAIPTIVAALHGIQFMGWIVAIFLLGMSISIPIWTKIGEKITNKKAFEISLVLFVLGAALQGMAPNIIFFLCSRFIMGSAQVAWDLFLTLLPVTFLKILKLEPRSLALIASWNGAAILGPLVGGWLIDAFSWHWVFYINIPIGLIALIICLIYYKPVTSEKTPVFDIPGAGLLVIGLLLFLM
ncbi:MFS transporter, partial [Lactobacillus helveticus]|uniref:MFS transporter n=1 Tax=Lactobacillus helveticus TaxID=1587 RepID=UPI0020B6A279